MTHIPPPPSGPTLPVVTLEGTFQACPANAQVEKIIVGGMPVCLLIVRTPSTLCVTWWTPDAMEKMLQEQLARIRGLHIASADDARLIKPNGDS